MRYTEDPPKLILPTLATIKHIARREGMDQLTDEELDFVWDLLAKTGGAEVRPFDEYEAQADAATHALSEADAFVKRTGCNLNDAIWAFEEDYYEHLRQRYAVLEALDLNEIPGYNHPTKAVRLVKLFRDIQLMWILHLVEVTLVNVMELLDEALEKVNNLDQASMSILMAFAGGDNPADEALMLGLELQLNNIQLDEMLRIARHLDELSEFQNTRANPTPDPNGEEVVMRDIRELGEMSRASQGAYALPQRLRMKQAAMGELGIREPRTRRDKKQLLYLVVDGTGSMLFDQCLAASRAAGVAMNRLKAVIDGDAEVYLRFFDSTLRTEEHHANSPESARALMRIVIDPMMYQGNETIFDQPLDRASRRTQELTASQGLHHPELVFVTDGAAVTPSLATLHGVKMHLVQVGVEEEMSLSKLARRSGGIAIYAGVTLGME